MISYSICLSVFGLPRFAQRPPSPPMVLQVAGSSSLKKLNNIPLHVSAIYLYPPVNGNLGCFHLLATVNKAMINMVQLSSLRF